MGTTASLQTRIERLETRLVGARNAEKRARDAGTGYGNERWADHFESVALDLEQKIYELKLLAEKQ